MFNHHSIIPWGSFRGRQEEKWGSFRGQDDFGVNLAIISGLGIISGWGSFWGLYRAHSFIHVTGVGSESPFAVNESCKIVDDAVVLFVFPTTLPFWLNKVARSKVCLDVFCSFDKITAIVIVYFIFF